MTDWISPLIIACLVAAFVAAPQFKTIGTERAIVYSTSIVGVVALVWLLLAVSGCRRQVRAAEPEPVHTPWCFALSGEARDGTPVAADVCLSLLEACAEARRAARRYGAMGGVREVGECRWDP